MAELTADGRRLLEEVAERHNVSLDAVLALTHALQLGGGTQAQFNHPDLGGMGQWSQGGMIMVGDMFNHGLKARVDNLCQELARLLREQTLPVPTHSSSQSQYQGAGGASLFVQGSASSHNWWPEELGSPASTGSQNNLRYAWFSGARRLAIQFGKKVEIYDTGDHLLSGFSQRQGGDQSLTFTSQHGLVRVSELPVVDVRDEHKGDVKASTAAGPSVAEPVVQPSASEANAAETFHSPSAPLFQPIAPSPASTHTGSEDIFTKIERLSELHQKGILNDEEFSAKKAELLARI